MNLGDFNIKDLGKSLISNNPITNFVSDFVNELSNYLQNNQKSNNSNERIDKFNKEIQKYYDEREKIRNTTMLEEDKIYVLSGIYDNKLQVVDIENGDEIEIYVSTGDDSLDRFKSSDIYNRTYTMERAEFLNLILTDNVILHDGNLNTNTDKVEIKNNLAWRLLADLYESIKTTNGKEYKVVDIKDNEVYLTNADGSGGYFSIYKEVYPHFEIGDIVQRSDRTYNKIE